MNPIDFLTVTTPDISFFGVLVYDKFNLEESGAFIFGLVFVNKQWADFVVYVSKVGLKKSKGFFMSTVMLSTLPT